MIAFKVKSFGRETAVASLNRMFNDWIRHLPVTVRERLDGSSGRFVWIPDARGGSYSESDILDDVARRGPLYRKIMQSLIDEAEEE